MVGFEGWGDFDGSPLERWTAHQAAKGRLFPPVSIVDDSPNEAVERKPCGMCVRGWHHECCGCGCPCNADEDDAA